MILGFKTHFNDGTPTNFVSLIQSGQKIHSIREGRRWKKGMTIHMATGVRSKSYYNFCGQTVVSTQMILIKQYEKEVWVDGVRLSEAQIHRLSQNDGLTPERFWQWFHTDFFGQIIHWTEYVY